ncbi:helix-turn-helix domain-containing protein [Halomicroarcula sp. GCM10025709]|uniref:helix-turn-helix domain-containing protein n=1 Tax=Haloarcula TaxID=2237 RepID=UPI0024C2DA60|nr:helix-turn-helix domain-containing protein [Halomicroarcula sp. YJ-61-S]
MSSRVLAEVEVVDPQACQVQPHAGEDWRVASVSRSALGGDDEEVVEEFTLVGDGEAPPAPDDEAVEAVFDYEHGRVYRLRRQAGQGCVCERIERADCVVQELSATARSLTVTFLVEDVATLREVIADLQSTSDHVNLRRLVETDDAADRGRPVVLDREKLTARQREVLERAHELGYFEHPRGANAGEVADELGITTATFTEHLAAAQRKVFGDLLDEP